MNMFRVVMYVKNLNNDFRNQQDLIDTIQNYKYLSFINIAEVLETDIGEWHDDHELNKRDADYAKYFPDAEYHPDPSFNVKEYKRVKTIMLKTIKELSDAYSEISKLKEKVAKLEKVETFMDSMKDALK